MRQCVHIFWVYVTSLNYPARKEHAPYYTYCQLCPVWLYHIFLFQTFAMFWIYYVFFWVVPRRLNYIWGRFGTLYLFYFHRQVLPPAYEDGTDKVFRNVGIYNSDAGELPKRKHNKIYQIFPHYFINSKIFWKSMCASIFCTNYICNIFHSKKNQRRYYHKRKPVFMQSARYSCPILMKLEFPRKISEKSCAKFHENPSSGRDRQTDGWTNDRHDEANVRFPQF